MFPGKKNHPTLPTVDRNGCVQVNDDIELFLDESKFQEVLRRKEPTMWFWCTMTDMFGAWVPHLWIDKCVAVMGLTPQHTHQVLTKRADLMHRYFTELRDDGSVLSGRIADMYYKWPRYCPQIRLPRSVSIDRAFATLMPFANVWLGVSAENQEQADARIWQLRKTPAAVRFVSAEPLLGPIFNGGHCRDCGAHADMAGRCQCVNKGQIHQWIFGGESGPGSRSCYIDDIRRGVQNCHSAGVAAFVKQVGDNAWLPEGELEQMRSQSGYRPLRAPKGKDPTEWPADIRVREYPTTEALSNA